MTKVGKIFNKYVIDTVKSREYYLQIRKEDGKEYSKKVSKSTFLKKTIGQEFLYYIC